MRLYYSLLRQAFELYPCFSKALWILFIYIQLNDIIIFYSLYNPSISAAHVPTTALFSPKMFGAEQMIQTNDYKARVILIAKVLRNLQKIFSKHLQSNRMSFPSYLPLKVGLLLPPLGKLAMVMLFIQILVVEGWSLKFFNECFTQSTTTSSKIVHVGESSVAIFNPVNLKIGIFKFSNTFTTNFITLSGNTSGYVQGNFIYNRYGAQGIANREMFTLIGDEFYDGLMLAYSSAPRIWRVLGSEYVLKLMADNILWLSHWRNIKYIKVCNTSNLNVNSTLVNLSANRKERLYLFYADGQVVRLLYNDTLDNYTSEAAQLVPYPPAQSYVVSADDTHLFYHHKVSLSETHIYKFRINQKEFGFSLSDNFTLRSPQNITKIEYSENNLNFILQLSNNSFRVCGFNWRTCYHLTGVPAESITSTLESPSYLAKDFLLKNLTHFGFINFQNEFKLYQTTQFQVQTFLQSLSWPDGTADSEPLSNRQRVFNQSSPNYKYPALEINDQEVDFAHLSSSTIAIVYLVSLPQSRKVLMFLNPLYMLLQNFWLYSYQNKNFRPVVNRTLNIMRLINQVKLFPLPFYSIQNVLKEKVNFDEVTKSNFSAVSPTKFMEIEENDVSFLKNIQDSFIWGSIYTLVSFFFTKLLSKAPFKSKAIRQFLRSKSHNGMLFTGLIQSNIQFYAFMGFSQLKLTGQLQKGDKIKLIATVMILFVLFFYCIAGFMIMAGLFKKCWSVFIEDRQESRKSLYFSVIWLTLQSLSTGFVNGFFQDDAAFLQLLIIAIDGCSLGCVLYFWSTAQSYVSNILLTLYLTFKLIFDIVIYQSAVDEWVESFLIAAIILTILYSVFWNISVIYKDSCQIFHHINQNTSIKVTSKDFTPHLRQKKPTQALKSQIIFHTSNKIEGSIAQDPKPMSVVSFFAKKYMVVEKTKQFLKKIANAKNNQENPQFQSEKRVSLKIAGAQMKSVKTFRKDKRKLQCLVSGKISTKGEIQLQAPAKNIPQAKNGEDHKQVVKAI